MCLIPRLSPPLFTGRAVRSQRFSGSFRAKPTILQVWVIGAETSRDDEEDPAGDDPADDDDPDRKKAVGDVQVRHRILSHDETSPVIRRRVRVRGQDAGPGTLLYTLVGRGCERWRSRRSRQSGHLVTAYFVVTAILCAAGFSVLARGTTISSTPLEKVA